MFTGEFDPTTNEYLTGTGQILRGVHSAQQCDGQPCVIHDPSGHPMTDLPTHWRSDRGIMERLCEHGVGHPDPDDVTYHGDGVHACDGCCSRKARRRRDKQR